MFDIMGTPPHDSGTRKVASRDTEEDAREYAQNLASFGYRNLRVVEGESGSAVRDGQTRPEPAPVQTAAPAGPGPEGP